MRKQKKMVIALLLVLLSALIMPKPVYSLPSWPASWIQIDWDKNENGSADDWRDVEYAYYQYDGNYLYLKLKCYGVPGSEWPDGGRYKWFIDLDGDMYLHGGNIHYAEYLLFVEDTDDNGSGEMYLLSNTDEYFNEYEPWPRTNPADPYYYANYKVTDTNIGGWRIVGNQIEMYISWTSIGNPSSYWLIWATDQQNPNLDQMPTTDHPDEEIPIAVHDVAAISQTPSPTTVTQGQPVTIQVLVENQGTQMESFDVTCYFDSGTVGTLHVTNLAAGHSTTLSFDWDTTGIPPGTYTIQAWADSGAVITESDEADNWCTAAATVTIQELPVHDVAATSQVPDETIVVQGTTVNIDVTVENLGDYTETFNVACYYDSTQIGSAQTVTSLAPSASTHVFFAWDTTGVTPDTYDIKAMADSSRAITEVNENNNNCTSLATVTVYAPIEAGIFVDKAQTDVISGPDPPEVGSTTVYEITITVTNIGNVNLFDVVVEDTISSDVTFDSVGTPVEGEASYDSVGNKIVWTWTVAEPFDLDPGESQTLTFRVSLTPTAPGLKYLDHKEDLSASGYYIDPEVGIVFVFDYGHTDVTVTAIKHDVAAISQVPSSATVNQGETISIAVTVQNLGDQTESFDVTCYYDSTSIGTLRVYNLAPSNSETLTFAWDTTGVATGTYDIKAKADSSDEINESDETNNECTNPASVEIVIHDVAAISQTPSSTTVKEGETVTIDVVVENQGSETETFTVSCYYDSTQIETAKTVTSLAPSALTTVTFTWDTTGVPPGIYYISAVASTVPGEKDTDDNTCTSTATVTIEGSPVLTIEKTDSPDPVTPGGVITYVITYGNIGHASATNVVIKDAIPVDYTTYVTGSASGAGTTITYSHDNGVTYVLSDDPTLGPVTHIKWTIASLAAGTTGQVSFQVTVSPDTPDGTIISNSATIAYGDIIPPEAVTDTTVQQQLLSRPVGGVLLPISVGNIAYQSIALILMTTAVLATMFFVKRRFTL